jgi:hypothetical protein
MVVLHVLVVLCYRLKATLLRGKQGAGPKAHQISPTSAHDCGPGPEARGFILTTSPAASAFENIVRAFALREVRELSLRANS